MFKRSHNLRKRLGLSCTIALMVAPAISQASQASQASCAGSYVTPYADGKTVPLCSSYTTSNACNTYDYSNTALFYFSCAWDSYSNANKCYQTAETDNPCTPPTGPATVCQGSNVAAAQGKSYPRACSSYTTSTACTATYGYDSSSNNYYNCAWTTSGTSGSCGIGTTKCYPPPKPSS